MRKSDPTDLKNQFFRADERFFKVNGQWYFSAREGEIGPFRSREQARLEARAYVNARRAEEASERRRAQRTHRTVIPGYIYRSVLSMEQQVSAEGNLVLNLEGLD